MGNLQLTGYEVIKIKKLKEDKDYLKLVIIFKSQNQEYNLKKVNVKINGSNVIFYVGASKLLYSPELRDILSGSWQNPEIDRESALVIGDVASELTSIIENGY